ncbi:MAG: (2Fe-2S)-binding protein, partial [Ilumatobacteraceae bacterium]
MAEHYTLHVNGEAREVTDAWVGESLLHVLRERLELRGTKGACEQGECGSCSVLVDDRLVCSCLTLAATSVGRRIVTVEGVQSDASAQSAHGENRSGALTDVQRAFVEAGAVQCGFCTP